MKSLAHRALSIGTAITLLTACGGTQPATITLSTEQSKPTESFAPATAQRPHNPVTVLYSFGGPPDAAVPLGTLIADKNNLYGTSTEGGTASACGADGCGTVFELTPTASGYSERVIWSFGETGDGEHPGPGSKLVEDSAGALYGTTEEGGAHAHGIVFKLTPSGSGYTENVLYSFCSQNSCADGGEPLGGLTLDPKTGALYGTTSELEEPSLAGNIFKLTPSGSHYSEIVIWNFNISDGYDPRAPLIEGADGTLYGITFQGGAHSLGTIFKLSKNGKTYSEKVLLSFDLVQGKGPDGIFRDSNGAFYGTAIQGGHSCGSVNTCGTAFELASSGTGYTARVLWSFDLKDGYNPNSGLTRAKNGTFYGTNLSGGPNICDASSQSSCGRVFNLTPKGSTYSEHIIWNFNGKDGYEPGPLIFGPSGDLYGITNGGGGKTCAVLGGCGTVFKVSVR